MINTVEHEGLRLRFEIVSLEQLLFGFRFHCVFFVSGIKGCDEEYHLEIGMESDEDFYFMSTHSDFPATMSSLKLEIECGNAKEFFRRFRDVMGIDFLTFHFLSSQYGPSLEHTAKRN